MNAINPSDLQVCKILNIRQVGQYVGLSRSTIYELINPKSKYFDNSFPKPISLTTHRIGWKVVGTAFMILTSLFTKMVDIGKSHLKRMSLYSPKIYEILGLLVN